MRLVLLATLALLSAMARAQECQEVSTAPSSLDATLMKPGAFRLVLVATSGRKRGGTTRGNLKLNRTSTSDRSPKTGELADDSWGRDITTAPLYGWATANWRSIGAPVSYREARSRDPVYPGVLVRILSSPGYPYTPTLKIAGNARAGEITLDGAGIFLSVRQLDDTGFYGDWRGAGVVTSGSGHFCAIRLNR